jgi:hypothetical protein
MPKEVTNTPVAARTFRGLSDIGYTFESAVADLLDNSITQGEAKNIIINYDRAEKGLYLRVFDDGNGMSREKLFDAMTIGSSSEDYKEGDLSKYGFGMKTASLSQCRELTVVSKSASSPISAFSWNMEVVEKKGWKVLEYNPEEADILKRVELERITDIIGKTDILENPTWTMVSWDLLEMQEKEYISKKTEHAKDKYISNKIDILTIYLRTVFHRFLEGKLVKNKINIFLNGNKLKPFDPFCRKEKNTIVDPFYNNEGTFQFKDDSIPPIFITRYILPTKEGELGFSNLRKWKEAAGYLKWNDAQGYYVYRNNRLIDFGGWFSTKAKDEHDKLARVSIDLTDDHDKFFKLDVKKSSIQFSDDFKIHLKERVNKDYISRARTRYKKGEKNIPVVTNNIRNKPTKVSNLSSDLVRQNEIRVHERTDLNGTNVLVDNPSGGFSEKELLYRELDPKLQIITRDFGSDENFWKMVPGPGNYFQVLINESHPFYEKVYLKAVNNKIATSSVDALLYSLAFIELRFKTENNRSLFLEINEVASDILKRVIEKNLL